MPGYLYNDDNWMLHKDPATENCNLDDDPDEARIFKAPSHYNLCSYCFKMGEMPSWPAMEESDSSTTSTIDYNKTT